MGGKSVSWKIVFSLPGLFAYSRLRFKRQMNSLVCVASKEVNVFLTNRSGAAPSQITVCGHPALSPSQNALTFALLGKVNMQLPLHI